MSQIQAILHYQEIDTKLYKLERTLAASDERKEYVKAKKFLEAAPEKLDALEVKAAALKTEAAELTAKYAQTEETLKEFDHLDELVTGGADIAFYKKNAQTLAEQLKKLKADLAALTANVKAVSAEYQKLKKQVIAVQKQYADASEKYKAAKAAQESERKEIVAELATVAKDVPPAFLEQYQTKRKEKIFPVVGALAQGRCPYCSMEPPLAARNQLASGGSIECDNCHRILFGA